MTLASASSYEECVFCVYLGFTHTCHKLFSNQQRGLLVSVSLIREHNQLNFLNELIIN